MEKSYKFNLLFKKAWSWIWNKTDELENSKKDYTLDQRVVLLKELKGIKYILEQTRLELDSEKARSGILNRIITEKLKTKNITFVCKNCTFKGKEYRDFCPCCGVDGNGKTKQDFINMIGYGKGK